MLKSERGQTEALAAQEAPPPPTGWRAARLRLLWVAEDYPCESVTELGEGRLSAVLRTPDTRWVRRLALRLGEEARVVSPAALAAAVRDDAAAALALYA